VLEVRGEERLARRALESAGDGRFEVIGDTYYYYTRDARAVVKRLEDLPGLTFLHRPANLEDVFLKLTGRELRD
jgi:lipooligosaccharide transport system ATP-binding protein